MFCSFITSFQHEKAFNFSFDQIVCVCFFFIFEILDQKRSSISMATLNTPRSQSTLKMKKIVRRTSIPSKAESTSENTNIVDEKYECVTLVWFDPQGQSNINLIGSLRVINDSVQVFTDSSTCLDMIQSSMEKIFFISSSNNNELISMVHACGAVEAIFILTGNGENVKGDFPKLFGVFNQQEELLRVLKEIFDLFEQVQLEDFHFEAEKVFLWSQLWKEDVSNELDDHSIRKIFLFSFS